ncbi:hypothetical protein [uncultured Aquimonas sp.]|uniref:hypothetical protein n=1 Tax=uncultured Aquimonas sp. TaxID=385483 RepID=UPI00262E2C1E|nr:hypothetical protein [uncultured Aquimonas sp.]
MNSIAPQQPSDKSFVELIPDKNHREYIDARINDIERAAVRSRWLFGFNIALSWLLISMAYNSTWSWMRTMAQTSVDLSLPREDRRVRHALQEDLFGGWVHSLYFDVPFLGARFSASDAGVVGGLLLVLVATWCFYAGRRENHLVFYLVRDCERYRFSTPMRRYLRNQLHATQLFASTNQSAALDESDFAGVLKGPEQRTMRLLSAAMYGCAPLALGFLLLTDLYSLALESPFREQGILLRVFTAPCLGPEGFRSNPVDCKPLAELCIRLALSVGFFGLCTLVMWRGYKFQRATRRLISHMDKRMQPRTNPR